MIVAVDEIGNSGIDRAEGIAAEALDETLREAGESDWRAAGEATFEARFDKVAGKILMRARALVRLQTDCKRCLVAMPIELPFEFTVQFSSKPARVEVDARPSSEPKRLRDEVGTGASFDLSAPDEEFFDGKAIDTAEVFREQLLLNLPMGLVCRDDCKGLCPVCGEQLNQRECGCDRRPMDPRWEALRSIKLPPTDS